MEFYIPIKAMSVNSYYTLFRGRWCITPKGREYKNNILMYLPDKHIFGSISIDIVVYFKNKHIHDIDNVLKPLLDCLKDNVFGDDSLIEKLSISKKRSHIDEIFIHISSI